MALVDNASLTRGGYAQVADRVINRERTLVAQIAKLARYFHVAPGVFLTEA